SQLMEVTSYQVPIPYSQILVAIKVIEFSKNLSENSEGVPILRLISEFGRDVSASLDLNNVIQAALLNISQLIPSDVLEIKTWDVSSKSLVPFTLDMTGGGVVAQTAPQSQFGELTENLIDRQNPVLISDINEPPSWMPSLNGNSPVQSYLGYPLVADNELIGTLEFGHLTPGTLTQEDLDIVQMVSPQIAYSLRNALRYSEEQKRVSELSGLANLVEALSVSHDHSNLIQKLIESISPLFSVEILGFLLFDEDKRTLEAQSPFLGLPSHIVDIYRTSIPADGPAEKIINDRAVIATDSAANDKTWQELGLSTLAQAASLRESVLAPMIAGDRLVGYFQVSNHKQKSVEFTESEIQLVKTIAVQSAGIIENSVDMEQTRQRAMRSDALRRIASLASSTATIDEILQFSIQELARLFQGEIAAIFLRDEQIGGLRLHEESVLGVTPDAVKVLSRLHMDASQERHTVSGSQKPFLSGRLSSDRRILPVYRPLVTTLQVESAVVVPLMVRDQSLGELMLGSKKAEFFDDYDLQIIATAAGQLASALDDASRSNLTDEVMRRRLEQITSISRVTRELNSMTDLRSLLDVVYNESLRTTRADCGTIQIFDMDASSDEKPVSLSIGCDLPDSFSPLDRQVMQTGMAQYVKDITEKDNIQPHEGVRSLLLVPIINRDQTIGLIHLHSEQPDYFDDAAVEVMQTFSSQVSVAINNVQRYQGQFDQTELLRRRAEILSRLSETSLVIDFENPLEQTLRTIAENISKSTNFNAVLISIYEQDEDLLRRVVGVGFPQATLNELFSRKQPFASLKQILKPEFLISRSYFIPIDKSPIVP
ncbi:MAG: GAF domain-containing protein, partial [Anaerolineales bacterium]|nr:GAF domain-containing protein [Anaerolineales bacterium]